MTADAPQHIVVMGVSGCGKTTVAEALAAELHWPFAEGDLFHPQANIDKMAAHSPLTDADRWPWLRILADWITKQERSGHSSVLSCSALKRSYRDVLRGGGSRVRFVHLHGDRALLAARLQARAGHFFPAELLETQYATLEPLGDDEDGIVVDLALTPADQVRAARLALGLA